MSQDLSKRRVLKALELHERGVMNWLEVVVRCVEDVVDLGVEATLTGLPADVLIRLREDKVIKHPPAADALFPYQAAGNWPPNVDLSQIDRRKCLGAKLLHDYFYPADK